MVTESIAIIAVLLLMAFMSLRAGKKGGAKIALPFLCLPVSVLAGEVLFFSFYHTLGLRYYTVRLGATLIGVALGGAVCMVVANVSLPKKARAPFIIGSLAVIVLMALAYILPVLN